MERLRDGETVVIAEGYLFVFERRGYLKAGAFVPEVVVEYPELVRIQYEEFVRAGSDVVLAFTVSTNIGTTTEIFVLHKTFHYHPSNIKYLYSRPYCIEIVT